MADTQSQNGTRMDATKIRAAKTRRRWIINIIVIVVILAAVGYFVASRRKPVTDPTLVSAPVTRMDLTETISATGAVTAQTGAMVKIGSQITGRIKRLYADIGTRMRPGEIIAELDLPDLTAQVSQAKASLDLARARLNEQLAGQDQQSVQATSDLSRAQAGLNLANATLQQVKDSTKAQLETAKAGVRQAQANQVNSSSFLQRQEQLSQKGYIAASDVDTARAQAAVNDAQLATAQQNLSIIQTKVKADLNTANAQVGQAKAALAAARAETAMPAIKAQQVAQARWSIDQAKATLAFNQAQADKAFIRSPIAGTVIQLTQQQGETIAAGLSAPTLIIVADLDRLQVDAYVDETDIGKVRLGQPATVTVDAYPDHPFRGRVAKIASGSTTQNNVVTYDVTIALENPGHLLKPDMTATVNIIITQHSDALVVPVDAVKPTKTGPTVTLMTKGRDGKTTFIPDVPVKTGISDGEHTEILSGLREGQQVVLAGQVPGMSTETRTPNIRSPLGMGGPGHGGGGGGGRGGR